MTNKQIYEWLEEQGYETTLCNDFWVGGELYYKEDMPRILREFMDYCNYLSQKSPIAEAPSD